LEYNNTTSDIAFLLLFFNADTLITDFVYALFDLVQPMFAGKSWKKGFSSSGKSWNFVFASPGKSWKKHLNVCTNPVL